jgi:glucose dehydrogenase
LWHKNSDESGSRKSDLYSDCILALDPDTGKLKWYSQFMPHDTHDWDANEAPVLLDTEFRGRARKLLVQANRNGFYHIRDRTNGEFLLAEPFVKELNWAKGHRREKTSHGRAEYGSFAGRRARFVLRCTAPRTGGRHR